MKKLILLAFCGVALPFFAAAQDATTVIEKYSDQPIHGIIVSGAFDVQLQQADGASRKVGAKVEIETEFKDDLIFDYTDEGYVRLTFKNDMTKYFTSSKRKPQAWITVTDLRYVNITGASNVVGTGKCATTEDLRILTSGNASVNLLTVSAKSINIEVSGASDLSDTKLTATDNVLVVQSGTSKITGKLNSESLNIDISGVASLKLSGDTKEAVLEVGGTSSANLENLNINTVKAEVNGMGKIRANILVDGTADISTMGSFRYTGDGMVKGKGVKRLD